MGGKAIDAQRIDAVVFDLDGVITRTADIHQASWKRLFDEYLSRRAEQLGVDLVPFTDEDYLHYIDGKPRYDGVASFLESRGIHLPWGTADDLPDAETVSGLGNRKDGYFIEHVMAEGVEPFHSSVDLVRSLQREGFGTALISSSQNARPVLTAAGLSLLFPVVIDGVVASELGIPGKPDPAVFREATRRLGALPGRTAIVEDALSGVEAGREGGFAMIIGVDRADQASELLAHGATVTVSDLAELEVVPPTPVSRAELANAMTNLGDLDELFGNRRPAVFLDYDGTLTPIVEHPDDAHLDEDTRALITDLASLITVAVVSGRDVDDVRQKMGVQGIYYAGSHGFDILGPDGNAVTDERLDILSRYLEPLDRATQLLEQRVGAIVGSQVERKRYATAIHFRRVDEADVARIEAAVGEVAPLFPDLRMTTGKKVFELRPAFDWDKGRALDWLLRELHLDFTEIVPVYIGDDTTDEDAFRAIRWRGIGIVVGEDGGPTLANLLLADTDEVQSFLAALAERERGR